MSTSDEGIPKRIVRTITLTEEDLFLLDGIERILSKSGQRVKTDSKLIRTAIQVAHDSLHGKEYEWSRKTVAPLAKCFRSRVSRL